MEPLRETARQVGERGTRPRGRRRATWNGWGAVVLASLMLVGCERTGVQSMLNPSGPRATEIADLWWLMFFMGLAVYVVVMGFALYALFNRWRTVEREEDPDASVPPLGHTPFVILGGAVVPAGILTVLLVFALDTQVAMNDRPAANLTIRVVGHQWWWEVEYPAYDITTANEIYIPTNEPVRLELTSADVIHSFWVPRLGGKRDLLPDKENTLWIEADTAAVYRGQCAEYCGLQHTHMAFRVVAVSPEEFDAWVVERQAPRPVPASATVERGRQVFMASTCVECHRIEGTLATGEIGPDLTHIGSRRTLGAGMIENNRGNLYGWIVNAQRIKPGNRMPPIAMEPDDLHALVAYLQSLK